MVQSQAVMLATNHVFLAISILMVISVGAVWLTPKPRPGAMTGGAGAH
jgi:DHA2 family multidrug resistance protein